MYIYIGPWAQAASLCMQCHGEGPVETKPAAMYRVLERNQTHVTENVMCGQSMDCLGSYLDKIVFGVNQVKCACRFVCTSLIVNGNK